MSILRGPQTPIRGIATCERPFGLAQHTVADAPDPAAFAGYIIYVSDGGAGDPVIAFSDGTDWLRSDAITTAIAIV